jgi:hypothetical protein
MDSRDELVRRLATWWPAAVEHRPIELGDRQQPELPQAVGDLDARTFLRGLDASLYEVVFGYLRSSMLAPRRDGSPKDFHLFETTASGTQLRAETFAHYGGAAELVLDFGWPVGQIESEPVAPAPNLSKGSVDLVVRLERRALLCVEAKADAARLSALVRGINVCMGETFKGHSRSDHKKCEGLLAFRPSYLWGVACGWTRRLFEVDYADRFPRLHELDTDESLEFPSDS